MNPLFSVLLIVVLLGGCESSPPAVAPTQIDLPTGCDASISDLSQEPNYSANYLHRWTTKKGCDVRLDILMTRQGKEACGGEEVADILMGTPLGRPLGRPPDSSRARIYIKDPTNVFNDDATSTAFKSNTALPNAATDSGFRQDGAELWTVPDDHTQIYLVFDDRVEAWPLDETPPGCD